MTMSTVYSKEVKCPACGKISMQQFLGSTNTMGPCDLDFRPAEMARDTMEYWIHECPECGFVTSNFEDEGVNPKFLTTGKYRTCDGISFKSGLAAMFYRAGLISEELGYMGDAARDFKCASWACDDAEDEENAVKCRDRVIDAIDRLPEQLRIEEREKYEAYLAVQADMLRRNGRFSEVFDRFDSARKEIEKEEYRKMIEMQLYMAYRKKTDIYNWWNCENFIKWHTTPIEYKILEEGRAGLSRNRALKIIQDLLNNPTDEKLCNLREILAEDVKYLSISDRAGHEGREAVMKRIEYSCEARRGCINAIDAVITGIKTPNSSLPHIKAGCECLAIWYAEDEYYSTLLIITADGCGKINRIDVVSYYDYEPVTFVPEDYEWKFKDDAVCSEEVETEDCSTYDMKIYIAGCSDGRPEDDT